MLPWSIWHFDRCHIDTLGRSISVAGFDQNEIETIIRQFGAWHCEINEQKFERSRLQRHKRWIFIEISLKFRWKYPYQICLEKNLLWSIFLLQNGWKFLRIFTLYRRTRRISQPRNLYPFQTFEMRRLGRHSSGWTTSEWTTAHWFLEFQVENIVQITGKSWLSEKSTFKAVGSIHNGRCQYDICHMSKCQKWHADVPKKSWEHIKFCNVFLIYLKVLRKISAPIFQEQILRKSVQFSKWHMTCWNFQENFIKPLHSKRRQMIAHQLTQLWVIAESVRWDFRESSANFPRKFFTYASPTTL